MNVANIPPKKNFYKDRENIFSEILLAIVLVDFGDFL